MDWNACHGNRKHQTHIQGIRTPFYLLAAKNRSSPGQQRFQITGTLASSFLVFFYFVFVEIISRSEVGFN